MRRVRELIMFGAGMCFAFIIASIGIFDTSYLGLIGFTALVTSYIIWQIYLGIKKLRSVGLQSGERKTICINSAPCDYMITKILGVVKDGDTDDRA